MRTVKRELPELTTKLREARKNCGLTQQQMAEIFEMPKRTIEEWERGASKPPLYVAKLILEKLESISKGAE